jgi:hypothetical protein
MSCDNGSKMKNETIFLHPKIKAVCFDAFGTVVDIVDKRRPYVSLLQAMSPRVRMKTKDRLMRELRPASVRFLR